MDDSQAHNESMGSVALRAALMSVKDFRENNRRLPQSDITNIFLSNFHNNKRLIYNALRANYSPSYVYIDNGHNYRFYLDSPELSRFGIVLEKYDYIDIFFQFDSKDPSSNIISFEAHLFNKLG